MASKSRIDETESLRMFVFKDKDESNGKYAGRPMLVSEREKSMGFPLGYIKKPGVSTSQTIAFRNSFSVTKCFGYFI